MLEEDDKNKNASCDGDAPAGEYADYLERAVDAHEAGKLQEALLLYLLAFERAVNDVDMPVPPSDHPVVEGLKCAWMLSIELGDRSMAEHVLDLLQTYLTQHELDTCAGQLQSLALSQLKTMGMSEEEVSAISELMDADVSGNLGVDVRIPEPEDVIIEPDEPTPDGLLLAESPESGLPPFVEALAREVQDKLAARASQAQGNAAEKDAVVAGSKGFADLAGYDEQIVRLKSMGFGMFSDESFRSFVDELNKAHGISSLPSFGTLLFRSVIREDATRLMLAAAVEMKAPTVRMYMDENAQGLPILCVLASPDFRTKGNVGFAGTIDAGVLILEDVDLWGAPFTESAIDDMGDFMSAQISNGVRRAVTLIRSAVDNPNVTVLASASTDGILDEFILDLLSPVEPFDIPLPGEADRLQIWDHLSEKHPSLADLDKDTLVRLSFGLSRYDIFYAAREAVEQAYKDGLAHREVRMVRPDEMYEKLAAFQPLASAEYKQLEDAVIERFKGDIDDLEASLGDLGEQEA
ncbi:MAG: ribonucleotide reductase subunit alpha [Eggerthellaceae bacterium]